MTEIEPEPTHDTPEDRAARGEEVALFEDLDALDLDRLYEIAGECLLDADPDSCVPCRAFAIIMERREAEIPDGEIREESIDLTEVATGAINTTHLVEVPGGVTITSGTIPASPDVPVAQQFAAQVEVLSTLVATLLEGPPIPPPNVTLEELAALIVGAEMWSKQIDAQGLELAAGQKAIKDTIDATIRKVRK